MVIYSVSLFYLSRLLAFGVCLIGATVCFFVAFITLPMLALKPSKFALAFRYVFTLSLQELAIVANIPGKTLASEVS